MDRPRRACLLARATVRAAVAPRRRRQVDRGRDRRPRRPRLQRRVAADRVEQLAEQARAAGPVQRVLDGIEIRIDRGYGKPLETQAHGRMRGAEVFAA